jgi:glycosyltransferase involved in cell wall biosynthesis
MEPGGGRIDVSIVLPVFNEAGHVAEEVARIREAMDRSGRSYEIVVVDDGSTDGSGAEIEAIPGLRLIRFAQNRGSGTARRHGSTIARGDVIVWTDADMSYPNDRIPELVEALTGVDQVVGARRSEAGTLKLLRRPAKWLIRRLASYLTGVRIPDLNSGFRAFRAEVGSQFLHLLPTGFSCVTTLTMTFLTNGYSVRYVPIDYAPRRGKSKFHWWSDTRKFLLQVVRMTLSYAPLKVLGPPAVLLGVAGVAKLVYDVFDKSFRVGTNTLVVLGVAGLLLVTGLVADLVVQLNRPRHDVLPATAVDRVT